MEVVKGTIPWSLLEQIETSRVGDLASTCSELFYHTTHDPTCWQLIEQLCLPANTTACAKDLETAQLCKDEGKAAFRASSFQQALDLYTKALRYSPFCSAADRMNLATLFVNRATALHAWYRRGRASAALKLHEMAIEDLEQTLFYEASANGKNDVSRELERVRTLMAAGEETLDLNCGAGPKPWGLIEVFSHDGVSPYWTPEKHWGVQATKIIKVGSLVLEEEPITALISTDHRNARCHFCFDMLPPDPVACFGCAIPIFCDEPCLSAACDESSKELDGLRWKGEHMHECFGMSWTAVLPTDVVLAARLFARGQGNARLEDRSMSWVITTIN